MGSIKTPITTVNEISGCFIAAIEDFLRFSEIFKFVLDKNLILDNII